jgi:quercetin dioxygenase-like cupin family protein
MNDIQYFEDEAQAYAEIEAMGYHALALDFAAEESPFHWHDFDSVLYITGGEVKLTLESGEKSVRCQRGAKIVASAGVVHKEQTEGYSAIIGFSVPVAELTQPVNKALPVSL